MNISTRIARIVLVTLFFAHHAIFSAKIIFDLGGVLMATDKSTVFKRTKPASTIFYAIGHMKNPRTALFAELEEVEPFNEYQHPACDEKGNPLPSIFCDFLAGVPSEQVLEHVADTLGTSSALWNLAQGIFDPTIFADSLYIITDGEELVQECIEQGHEVYILSNLDAKSFAILKARNPEFFNLFAGTVVSGECHLLKPDPAIYEHLITTYKLNKPDCVFIDDQLTNIEAAREIGIHSIHCKSRRGKPNYNAVRTALNEWLEEREARS